MAELFAEYKTLIVFLHVMSAVVWVGGMIAMRYAAHPSFMEIESGKEKLERVTHALKRLFTIVFPFTIILVATAVVMLIGYDLKSTEYAQYGYIKEGIWSVMFVNFIVMISRRNRAAKLLVEGDVAGAKFSMALVGKYMIPVNIALGVIAIFLGSSLSSVL
ncbi:hypothetical protein JHD48_00430 [Sulfurimonas sp. SAG-AH-194-I05]|nr:hypothetical protein [Sulfurimonas sp. SAG-AH-194-I05]MDF1874192.1 hypothetical protein [Sulfurimonas sp. SAG-AH-194-I05]